MNKEDTIKLIASTYQSTLRKHNFFPNFNQELAFYEKISSACVDHKPWEKFILMIETAYLAMPSDLRKIIKYDYFYKNYSFWWEEDTFLTKKKYLECKENAIESFYGNLSKLKLINKNGEINYELFK